MTFELGQDLLRFCESNDETIKTKTRPAPKEKPLDLRLPPIRTRSSTSFFSASASKVVRLDPRVLAGEQQEQQEKQLPSVNVQKSKQNEEETEVAANLERAVGPKQPEKKKLTTGPQWFDMPAVEMTDELKRDLRLIQIRSVLDPKRFYKKDSSLLAFDSNSKSNNSKSGHKFLQIGTIVDSPLEPSSDRLTKKERKRRIVDELLADTEKRSYFKRKFIETHHRKSVDAQKQRYKKKGKPRKS